MNVMEVHGRGYTEKKLLEKSLLQTLEQDLLLSSTFTNPIDEEKTI